MKKHGIASSVPRHIDHYLSMDRSEFKEFSAEDLFEMAYEVQTYLYHLQTFVNLEQAKADRCRGHIERLIGPVWHHYDHIFGNDQRMMVAISENEHAKEFRNIEINCRAAIQRTAHLPKTLESIARCLSDLAYTKRKHNA